MEGLAKHMLPTISTLVCCSLSQDLLEACEAFTVAGSSNGEVFHRCYALHKRAQVKLTCLFWQRREVSLGPCQPLTACSYPAGALQVQICARGVRGQVRAGGKLARGP